MGSFGWALIKAKFECWQGQIVTILPVVMWSTSELIERQITSTIQYKGRHNFSLVASKTYYFSEILPIDTINKAVVENLNVKYSNFVVLKEIPKMFLCGCFICSW